MSASMNTARRPGGDENPDEPFVPDFSEGAETGLYLALLELLDEGLIITGDEVILEVNSAACRLLGRDYRQLAGQPLSDIFPSERAFLTARARLFIQGEMRGSLQVATPAGTRDLKFIAAARIRPGIHALILSPDLAAEGYAEAAGEDSGKDTLWPRLAAALEQPVLVIDDGGYVAAANAAALRTLTVERAALVGHPLEDCVQVDWPAADAAPLATLQPPAGPALTARVLPGPKPDWRLLILPPVAAIAAHSSAPQPAAARRDAVPVPRASAEVFRRVFADSPLPTLLCQGTELRILAANAAAAGLYGYGEAEMAGLAVADLRAAGDHAEASADSGEWHLRTRDGRNFRADVLCYPLELPQAPHTVVLTHDLPDAPLFGARLRIPLDVLDAANQAILVSDAANRILAVNKAFTEITGYTLDDVRGQDPAMLGADRPDRNFAETLWRELASTGQWQGEIWNRRKNGETYPEWLSVTAVRNARGEVLHYIGVFSDLSARRQAESRADYVATHDILTGLPNRRLFERRFIEATERARDTHRSVGLMRIDLDSFKTVNREFGDNIGDDILQQIARRLQMAVPRGTTVARERSDTFLALLPDANLTSEFGRSAEAILAALGSPFDTEDRPVRLGASIGIAVFPDNGSELNVLARHAEAALAHARQLGGNNYQYYADEMDGAQIERTAFEINLRHAVEREQLEVHFQPLVDGRDGSLRGGEALLRWRHPDLGLIPFRRFLGAARDGGILAELGDWVLHAACRHAALWPADGEHPPLLTINVAIEQIMQGDLAERVAMALQVSGLAAERLELDIDEIVLKEEHSRILGTLEKLAALGVRLAIDDFGRGLSSIPRLKRYPLRAIKLDPALVRDVGVREEAEAVVEAMTSMAGILGLEVFARGVEGEAQQAFLCALDCHLQQGPLFGRPMGAEEFAAYVADRGTAS